MDRGEVPLRRGFFISPQTGKNMATRTSHGLPGIYNASLPTLSDGKGSALAIDSGGRLILSSASSADNAPALGNPTHVAGRYESGTDTYADGDVGSLHIDVNGNLKVVEQYAPGYEDNTNNKAIVEHRYTSSGVLTADTLVKTGAGLVHTITIAQNDAAPTAGTIDVYDNTSATGTKIFTWTLTTAVFTPFSVVPDVSVSTGIYVDFTTTADVAVFVSYR